MTPAALQQSRAPQQALSLVRVRSPLHYPQACLSPMWFIIAKLLLMRVRAACARDDVNVPATSGEAWLGASPHAQPPTASEWRPQPVRDYGALPVACLDNVQDDTVGAHTRMAAQLMASLGLSVVYSGLLVRGGAVPLGVGTAARPARSAVGPPPSRSPALCRRPLSTP